MNHYGLTYYNKCTAVVLHNKIYKDSPEDVIDNDTQANWISKELNELGYNVIKMQFTTDCINALSNMRKSIKDLLVINMVDATPKEENLPYLVPAILEYLKIKYTGCSHDAMFLTTNKVHAKRFLHQNAINTPAWYFENDIFKFVSNEKYIIKALYEDASIGLYDESVQTVTSIKILKKLIDEKQEKIGIPFFAEKYIEGREFNVCIYGEESNPTVLPPYEWVFDGFEEKGKIRIINYDAKWTEGTFEYEHIIPLYDLPKDDDNICNDLKSITKKCWDLFKLRGYARVDFRVDICGEIWVLEINCNPSFYGFRNLARHKGLDFKNIIKSIVKAV